MSYQDMEHPQLGKGQLIRSYMGDHEWEVEFASGRRFRLPASESLLLFKQSSTNHSAEQPAIASIL